MCTARGAPEPTFAWFRGVTELTASDPRVTITPGPTSGAAPDFVTVESTISITESLETDVGTYSCVASNMVFSEPRSDTVDFTVMINCEFFLFCVCVSAYVCTVCVHACICVYVCKCIHASVCMRVCMCMHVASEVLQQSQIYRQLFGVVGFSKV